MGKVRAKGGNVLIARRPAWNGVYAGYPKVNGGTASEGDEDADIVFYQRFWP